MLKSFSLAGLVAIGTLASLPTTSSAMVPAPSLTVGATTGSNIETVRMRHRMLHMKRMRRGGSAGSNLNNPASVKSK